MLKKNDRIEIHIDRLSTGGRGVGRHEGLVVFVSDTAPDERVLVEITFVKKSFAEGRLVQIIKPSPFRVKPPCPVSGLCGGCNWQHVSYEEQLRQKRGLVLDALHKFSGRGPIEVHPVVPSPSPFHYRNRVQFHFEQGRIGFFRRGSHQVIDIKECLITEPELNREIEPLRQRLVQSQSRPTRVELFRTPKGGIAQSNESRYEDELGFAQVNTAQNEQLIQNVLDRLAPDSNRVFDLYAGAGNFTFPIADRLAVPVVAVELHPKSVRQGRDRAQREGYGDRVRFVEDAVESFFAKIANTKDTTLNATAWEAATVILDPPRTGCAPTVLSALATLKPQRILYVSCHPVTLARDLSALKQEDYTIDEVLPFDMFPQTDHVETLVQLTRIDKLESNNL